MSDRKPAPFFVFQSRRTRRWVLSGRAGLIEVFNTQSEAIDYAYKSWPWWP